MLTQRVAIQSANLIGNSAGGAASKGKQTGSGFDMIIGNNLKVYQNTGTDADSVTVKRTSFKSDDSMDAEQSNDADITARKSDDIRTDKAADQTKTTSQTDDTQEVKVSIDETKENKDNSTDVTVDEQLLAQITGMLQSIQEAVMTSLNLTPEELNQLLDAQGMTLSDLMNPEKLQQLILANSGQTDILAVLTDESLADQMNKLLHTVEGIIDDTDLALSKEQIDAIISQADQNLQAEEVIGGLSSNIVAEDDETSQQTKTTGIESGSSDDEDISINGEQAKDSSSEGVQVTDTKQSNSGAQGDTSEHNGKDFKPEDQFQNFVNNLVNVSTETQVDLTGNMAQAARIREIANQIIDHIKVSVSADQTSMELQLNPENLGKVNLTIQSKDGVMTAHFVVQNQISKEAIESQIQVLRETLSGQGLKVEAIEVTVANYDFNPEGQEASQNQSDSQQKSSNKEITLEEAMNMNEEIEEENTSEDNDIRGSQIDYTA